VLRGSSADLVIEVLRARKMVLVVAMENINGSRTRRRPVINTITLKVGRLLLRPIGVFTIGGGEHL
jgi:hypothetical protein